MVVENISVSLFKKVVRKRKIIGSHQHNKKRVTTTTNLEAFQQCERVRIAKISINIQNLNMNGGR